MNHLPKKVFLILLTWVFVSACSVEGRLASKFIKQQSQVSLLLYPPDFLYKTNLKAFEIEGADTADKHALDSMLYFSSKYVQFVPEKQFIEAYVNAFLSELQDRKLNVYLPGDSLLFAGNSGEKFVVGMVQTQLEEDVEQLRQDEVALAYYNLGDILINIVRLNAWFEIANFNSYGAKTTAFAQEETSDMISGRLRFYPLLSEFRYQYRVDTLTFTKISEMAVSAGKLFAGYLTDHLMNDYIDRNLPQGVTRNEYLSYSEKSNPKLTRAGDRRFQIIR